ncbi:MAG: SDR family oxidoreductase [Deltaproteobacteria bacterium]|nr:SDR family oxidoreductase [Deltaproteobacteria bacterium]MBW2075279.1 SDR family oxidoreductase [Deltaproteobacteria bacterium]RLB81274.1 MAG: LPS biosynthesis protein WbpP [Deltaproteobacteria bacterium]
MANFLVTGGAGFIGSNIVKTLLNRGDTVRVLDNFSTGKRKNLNFSGMSAERVNNLETLEGDITDLATCRQAMDGIQYVLHQAAIPSVPRSVALPIESNNANINGTLNLLVAARDAGVKRLVFASSSAVYGNAPGFPRKETISPAPLSPYAVQKLTDEHYLRVFYELYGLETVSLRYFNVFGPHQDPDSEYAAVIPRFIKAFLTGTRPTVYGDGEQSRDFTYVDNVVYGNLLAVEAQDAPGKVMNLACGGQLTLNQLLALLRKITGSDTEAIYTDPRPGDVRHSWADITVSEQVLNYKTQVPLEEGLRRAVDYFGTVFHT